MSSQYALISPARNEERVIGHTIEAVLAQSVLPSKWIIVSDGSTDRTDEIVAGFAKHHSFITLVRVEARKERSFSSKVLAFRKCYQELCQYRFDYVGNLDADVSFQEDYFETLLQRFGTSPELGIAGGIIRELINGRFEEQRISLDSVAGAVQLFRRTCYEGIGGYVPLKYGGIDSAAEIMARMHGWAVRTFPDLKVQHHRPVSSGSGGLVRTKLKHGLRHYALGYHPVFELIRCVYRIVDRPYVVGAMLMTCGYFWGCLTRMKKDVPPEVVQFLRSEQMSRLRARGRGLRTTVVERSVEH